MLTAVERQEKQYRYTYNAINIIKISNLIYNKCLYCNIVINNEKASSVQTTVHVVQNDIHIGYLFVGVQS